MDQTDHFANAFFHENVAYGYDVMSLRPFFMPPTMKRLKGHIALGLSLSLRDNG